MDNKFNIELSNNIAKAAQILAKEGQSFNKHLLEQFAQWQNINLEGSAGASEIFKEHLLFYEAVAQTLGWIQQIVENKSAETGSKRKSPSLPVVYLQVIFELKNKKNVKAEARLFELLEENVKLEKPRRLSGVVAGLETWAKVELPDPIGTSPLDIAEIQCLSLLAGGRARWTALAPLKMYALSKGAEFVTPRSIFPPMGSAVSRGIESLLGFKLGESENDYTISRDLHLKLSDLAHSSIWDINSAFYRLGGGR